jgi:hypothetical protein
MDQITWLTEQKTFNNLIDSDVTVRCRLRVFMMTNQEYRSYLQESATYRWGSENLLCAWRVGSQNRARVLHGCTVVTKTPFHDVEVYLGKTGLDFIEGSAGLATVQCHGISFRGQWTKEKWAPLSRDRGKCLVGWGSDTSYLSSFAIVILILSIRWSYSDRLKCNSCSIGHPDENQPKD